MHTKKIVRSVALIIGIIVAGIAIYRMYFYVDILPSAPEYPATLLKNDVSYKINPATILDALDGGKTSVFLPANEKSIPALEVSPLIPWTQKDFLRVANALHEYVWKEALENYQLYSLDFRVPDCDGVFRVDHASFQFYQRQGNWHYIVHNMVIDLQNGYVDAGDNNGLYSGHWEDVDLDSALVNDASKALSIAEQNGGREASIQIHNDQNCSTSINFSPSGYKRAILKWEVTYWLHGKTNDKVIYKIMIDPFTSEYEVLIPG